MDIPEEYYASQRGEVYIRSPMVMRGYLCNDQATRDAFDNGWYRTGDIAYCDQGRWFIVDRAKVTISLHSSVIDHG